MKISNTIAVCRFSLTEMRQAKLWWYVVGLIIIGSALAEFGASVAITETAAHRMVFYAVFMRLAAVLVLALLVVTSISREVDDRVVDLILSRPIARNEWYLGKLLAFVFAAFVFAVLAAMPLVAQLPSAGTAWGASLVLELCIVVGAALAFAITVRHPAVAISAVLGFYLLARGIGSLVLLSRGPTADLSLQSNRFFAWMIETLAYGLPDLNRYTQTSWLIEALPSPAELASLLLQSAIYMALLSAIGLFDLYRRNF